jgi:hypothetical protein
MVASGDPAATEVVFHDYGGSKGPFYIALAKATACLQEQFKDVSQKYGDADKSYQEKLDQIKAADQKLTDIHDFIEAKIKEMGIIDTKIGDKQTVLDEIKTIAELGFGTKQLMQLRGVLTKMAASQGVKPAEAAAIFFNQIGNYQDLVSLELEVKGAKVASDKAKANVEFWQAQAKTYEAKSKARKTAIDFADKFVAEGVKQEDIPQWERIIAKAGVEPEQLANALEQYGSLKNLYQHQQEDEQKLAVKINVLTSQVKTLAEEKQQISASIGILQKETLTEMENVSQKALGIMDNSVIKSEETIHNLAVKSEESINSQLQNATKAINAVQHNTQAAVETLSKKVLEEIQLLVNQADQYASLKYQAGTLASELVIARALKSKNPELWQKLPFHSARELLEGIIIWSQTGGDHNPMLSSPLYPLSSKIQTYTKNVSLSEVLQWAIANIFSDEERKAAANGGFIIPRP